MYFRTLKQRDEYMRIMQRKTDDVSRWVGKNLESTEDYNLASTNDGLGMRVAIRSLRAKQLLMRLYEEVFSKSFAEPTILLNKSVWSAWFGYSEPIESLPYISLQ